MLGHRFNPKERKKIAYRLEFRNRRRMKGEKPYDFYYTLMQLAQKAYPSVIPFALAVDV